MTAEGWYWERGRLARFELIYSDAGEPPALPVQTFQLFVFSFTNKSLLSTVSPTATCSSVTMPSAGA